MYRDQAHAPCAIAYKTCTPEAKSAHMHVLHVGPGGSIGYTKMDVRAWGCMRMGSGAMPGTVLHCRVRRVCKYVSLIKFGFKIFVQGVENSIFICCYDSQTCSNKTLSKNNFYLNNSNIFLINYIFLLIGK